MQLLNKPNQLNHLLTLNKMKYARHLAAHVMLLTPKPQKTNTEKEYSPLLDQSQLKKISTSHLLLQSEKPLLEKLKNNQFASKTMQTTLPLLENVSKT
jgi:hypothetical protein